MKNSLILTKTLKNQHFCDTMENILMGWQIEREDFMNRYKMITICSLSIVCMLILSLLLPLTTSANDEESIKLKLHYEKSTVTANIAVNSKIYTGVVCKYIEVDNILEYDDLEYQTKENGKTLNLNKLENDNYITTIENVSKRYIVVYVSIGNCSICDYIDSKKDTTQETEKTETKKEENSKTEQENKQQDNSQQNTVVVSENSITENNANNGESSGNTTVDETESVPSDNTKNTEEIPEVSVPSTEEPKTENEITPATPEPEPEVPSTPVEDTTSKNEEKEKDNTNTTTKTQEPTQNSNNNSNNKNTGVVDKDSINPDEFEEIETVDKTKTASTVDSKMPQTGENDTAKFVGIIVFSIIGLISFYKYKESCKKALE